MENTRELIITTAFSFYSEPVWERVSLGKIAGKIGISKAAIFKHFKNKQDLEAAMSERIKNDFSLGLSKIDFTSPDFRFEAIGAVMDLMATHKEYLNYIFCTRQNITLDDVAAKCNELGIAMPKMPIDSDGRIVDMASYVDSVFVACTMLIGIGVSQAKGEETPDTRRILSLIKGGLENSAEWAGDSFRLAELDSVCRSDIENLADADKFTVAIANIIEKNGFQAVTVEALADELGIAKSSLYSKFESKQDIFKTIIQCEKKILGGFLLKNLQFARNNQEKIYVLMETMLFYFLKRRKVFVVLKWIQYSGEMNFFSKGDGADVPRKNYNAGDFFDADGGFRVEKGDTKFVLSWAFFAASCIAFHGNKHGWSGEVCQVALKKMHAMVLAGYAGSLE